MMKKIFLIFLFVSLFLLPIIKPNPVAALNECDSSRLQVRFSPSPLYSDFTGNIDFTITGSGLADGTRHRIRIACAFATNPTSNIGTVSQGRLDVTVSPNDVERDCLQQSYTGGDGEGNGSKDVVLQTEQGGEICKFSGAFVTTYRATCTLSANPTIVAPGGTVTISSSDAPPQGGKLIITPGGLVYPVPGNSFSQNVTAPAQEGNYNVDLKDVYETTTYCSTTFKVQLNPPSPGPTPTPSPPSVCPGLTGEELEKCIKCVTPGETYESGGAYTALGCIDVSPQGFVSWLLQKVIGIAGGIAFLLILFGGFQILTSTGDPEKLASGKDIVVSALAGLLMIIFSVLLLRIIGVDILQIPGLGG